MVRGKRATGIICAVVIIMALRPLPTGADTVAVPAPHIPVAIRRAVHDVPYWETSRRRGRPGIDLVAAVAVRTFPRGLWVTMTAVGYAESCGIPGRVGDLDTPYPSVGLFQVRLVHRAYLERVTGSRSPAVWTWWLQDSGHNGAAALVIYRSGGLDQWGAYTSGRYRLFLGAAREAVTEVTAQ